MKRARNIHYTVVFSILLFLLLITPLFLSRTNEEAVSTIEGETAPEVETHQAMTILVIPGGMSLILKH
jgi:hypothetical protein